MRAPATMPGLVSLQLYLLRQLGLSFAFALGGTLFTVFPILTVSAIHKLSGVGMSAVVGYLPLMGMDVAPFLVPLAFLLALVACFGRLASDNEWTAMRMAGVHPLRVLTVPLIVGVAFSLAAYVLLGEVRPRWKYEQDGYRIEAVKKAFRGLSPGRTELHFGEFYLNAAFREGNRFYEVVIEIPRGEDKDRLALLADEAAFQFENGAPEADGADDALVIDFVNVRSVKNDEFISNEHPRFRLPLDRLIRPSSRSQYKAKFKTSARLREEVSSGELGPEEQRLYTYEIHRRYALACSFLVFTLLGVPTGLWRKSSTQLGALASAVGFCFLYFVIVIRFGKGAAYSGTLHPVIAAWLANGLGVLGGIAFVRKVLWR